ncbi:DUF1461 domain-containing protein [Arthrobacter sp. Sa2CUA1]|uniref:DUF1461 domain-containing protein n=2 Tax=Arthrobacter gallicola TaxID=2762225 RepID=A0ABR8UU73_9MICC|nr:DUF1461 domain-containing protein [Arthrobacter gallicola]
MPNLSRYDSAADARPTEDKPADAAGLNPAETHDAVTNDAETEAAETNAAAETKGDAKTSRNAGAAREETTARKSAATEQTSATKQPAATNSAGGEHKDADGGPWYVSGAEHSAANTGSEPEQDAEDAAIQDAEAQRRSLERERAAAAKPVLGRVVQVMIAVFFPVMLLAAAIRAVATPMFLWTEYHRPGFPADSFGFSTEDRMTYGSYAVDYLLNFASPRYLGDLVTPDGDPLYLASEVSHMADVKMVLGIAFLSALGMALLSIAGGIYLARRCPGGIRRALFAGAVATLALIAGLLVAAVLAWEQFFTQVHSIFFSQGNWTFRLDDTLIRLFPSQFWMDSGGTVAALVLLASIIVLVFTWPTKRRRERSRLANEAARRRYLESLESV